MQYLQVKADSDQIKSNIRFATTFLISRELYTKGEVAKAQKNGKVSADFINTHFECVEVSKRNVYWLFGARFAKAQ